jgi:hypothetical protein
VQKISKPSPKIIADYLDNEKITLVCERPDSTPNGGHLRVVAQKPEGAKNKRLRP